MRDGRWAASAAMANAIAMRWSPRHRPRRRPARPLPCDDEAVRHARRRRCRAPRNPATSAAMRSLSLTRSSPAPRTVTSPPCAASAAMAGSSSIRPGTSSGAISIDPVPVARRPMIVPMRLAGGGRGLARTSTRAPKRRSTSMSAVRVGFSPTSSIVTREPGSAAAATIQNAADEKSPGTGSDCPVPAAGRRRPTTVRPSTADLEAERRERPLRVIARLRAVRSPTSCPRRAARRAARRS